jgi:PAS domain S-box-containing protein
MEKYRPIRIIEFSVIIVFMAILGLLFFGPMFIYLPQSFHTESLILLPLFWSAVRFGRKINAFLITILFLIVFLGTSAGYGVYKDSSIAEILTFLVVSSVILFQVGNLSVSQRDAENIMRHQNEFLNTVINSLGHPFYVIDAHNHKIQIANKAAMRHLAENATCYELVHNHPESCSNSGCPCPIESVKKTRKPFITEHLYYDADDQPGYVEIHAYPIFDDQGNVVRIIEYCLDITPRKQAEKSLWDASEKFRTIINASPIAVLVFDNLEGNISMWNPAAEQIFGWKEQEVLGTFNPIVPEGKKEEFLAIHKRVQQGEVFSGVEIRRKKRDGSLTELSLFTAPLRNSESKIYGVMAMLEDISSRKAAEKELQEAKKAAEAANRAKSEFLANMSHEIRTPLNAITGMTRLLLETRLDEEQRDYAETIQLSSELLLAVLNDILDFSKIDAGKMELDKVDFNIKQTVEDVIKIMGVSAQNKNIDLLYHIEPDLDICFQGDRNRLRQILINLVNNAIKFTPKGHVRITVQHAIVQNNLSDNHCTLHFEITDTGVGIPKDRINRLFQAFSQADSSTTRKYGGTGLGLVISKALVEMMNGQIGVDSEEGKGTRFWFTAVLEKSVKCDVSSVMKEYNLNTFHLTPDIFPHSTILLAEDNEFNRKVAQGILKNLKFAVDAVSDGKEAIRAVQTKAYDLVLMDVQMPEMDGIEATRHIRKFSDIPIIAMTAHAMQSDRQHCLDAGMNDYLTKPIQPEELLRVIEKYLHPIPTSAPIFDKTELIMRLGNDQELFKEVIALFLETTPDRIRLLKSALNEDNAESAKFHAHSLKGAFANIAAHSLRDMSLAVESAVKKNEMNQARSLISDLENNFEQFRRVLEGAVL